MSRSSAVRSPAICCFDRTSSCARSLIDAAAAVRTRRRRLRERLVQIALDAALFVEHLLAAIGKLLQRLVEARRLGLIDLLQGAPQIAARFLRRLRGLL